MKQLAAQLEELERKFDRRSGGSDRGGGGSPEYQGVASSEEQSDEEGSDRGGGGSPEYQDEEGL